MSHTQSAPSSSPLGALSRAHDLVFKQQWDTTELADIVERALKPFLAPLNGRMRCSGPPVMLPARSAIAVALALRELATNAVEYGALSNDLGMVEITWSGRMDEHQAFALEWRETGGPAVKPPLRQGFGSGLIERSLASELQGEVELSYRQSGFRCSLTRRAVIGTS